MVGRPEINIKPWDALQKDLKNGNSRVTWSDREPYAYWKGNAAVAVSRQELVKCNVSSMQDWNARIYIQVICILMVSPMYLVNLEQVQQFLARPPPPLSHRVMWSNLAYAEP
jgi:hypothetical protein